MEENLRKAWTEVIVPEELDAHLDDLGQAKVNAEIVFDMIRDYPLPLNSKVLMPGCGTGQIFDYLSPLVLNNYRLTFTDINVSFLNKLTERLNKTEIDKFHCVIDDIEETNLKENFDGVIPVLLLEQLDWVKATKTLVEYNPKYIYLIIQEQSLATDTITVNIRSRESIRQFSEMANPLLVPREELINFMSSNSYELVKTYKRSVPNNKIMVGLVFNNYRL